MISRLTIVGGGGGSTGGSLAHPSNTKFKAINDKKCFISTPLSIGLAHAALPRLALDKSIAKCWLLADQGLNLPNGLSWPHPGLKTRRLHRDILVIEEKYSELTDEWVGVACYSCSIS